MSRGPRPPNANAWRPRAPPVYPTIVQPNNYFYPQFGVNLNTDPYYYFHQPIQNTPYGTPFYPSVPSYTVRQPLIQTSNVVPRPVPPSNPIIVSKKEPNSHPGSIRGNFSRPPGPAQTATITQSNPVVATSNDSMIKSKQMAPQMIGTNSTNVSVISNIPQHQSSNVNISSQHSAVPSGSKPMANQTPMSASNSGIQSTKAISIDADKFKSLLNNNGRKEGWHLCLNIQDRQKIDNMLKETESFEVHYKTFESEFSKMSQATAYIDDSSYISQSATWENWKDNLLKRRNEMLQWQENTLDNLYKKVCHDHPLFVTQGLIPMSDASPNSLPVTKPMPQTKSSEIPSSVGTISKPVQTTANTNLVTSDRTAESVPKPQVTQSKPSAPVSKNPQIRPPGPKPQVVQPPTSEIPEIRPPGPKPQVVQPPTSKIPEIRPPGPKPQVVQPQKSKIPEIRPPAPKPQVVQPQASKIPEIRPPTEPKPPSSQSSIPKPSAGPNQSSKTKPPSVQSPTPKSSAVQPDKKIVPPRPSETGKNKKEEQNKLTKNVSGKEKNKPWRKKFHHYVESCLKRQDSLQSSLSMAFEKPEFTKTSNNLTFLRGEIEKIKSFLDLSNSEMKHSGHKNEKFEAKGREENWPFEKVVADSCERPKEKSPTQPIKPHVLPQESNRKQGLIQIHLSKNSARRVTDANKKSSPEVSIPQMTPSVPVSDSTIGLPAPSTIRPNNIEVPIIKDNPRNNRIVIPPKKATPRKALTKIVCNAAPPPSSSVPFGSLSQLPYVDNATTVAPRQSPNTGQKFNMNDFIRNERESLQEPKKEMLSFSDPKFFTTPRDYMQEQLCIKHLLEFPARSYRPGKIVLIIRGLPGSGKTFLARRIKEKEEKNNSLVKTRLLSLDDYFLVENSSQPVRRDPFGQPIPESMPSTVYEYDPAKENEYKYLLLKEYRKIILQDCYDSIILDSVNSTINEVRDFYVFAIGNRYIPYIIEMEAIVRRLLGDCFDSEEIVAHCYKHNRHGRSLAEIRKLYDNWELLSNDYLRVDAYSIAKETWPPSDGPDHRDTRIPDPVAPPSLPVPPPATNFNSTWAPPLTSMNPVIVPSKSWRDGEGLGTTQAPASSGPSYEGTHAPNKRFQDTPEASSLAKRQRFAETPNSEYSQNVNQWPSVPHSSTMEARDWSGQSNAYSYSPYRQLPPLYNQQYTQYSRPPFHKTGNANNNYENQPGY